MLQTNDCSKIKYWGTNNNLLSRMDPKDLGESLWKYFAGWILDLVSVAWYVYQSAFVATYSVTGPVCVCVCLCRLQGWFSPGQVFVLDEYCARYGVRGCHRHLSYLKDLMDYSENNALVDPTLLHYSYAFCASHVHGNRYSSSHWSQGWRGRSYRTRGLLQNNENDYYRWWEPGEGSLSLTVLTRWNSSK